jgi:hypothetical protein
VLRLENPLARLVSEVVGRTEVDELALLLPGDQLASLEQAAWRRGLSVAQLLRSLIQDFLAGEEKSSPIRGD